MQLAKQTKPRPSPLVCYRLEMLGRAIGNLSLEVQSVWKSELKVGKNNRKTRGKQL
jgi:hypothetical protein